jgi:MYXO-CTERM domain-containing protein
MADTIADYPVVAGLLAAPLVHFCTPADESPAPRWKIAAGLLGGVLLGLAWSRRDRVDGASGIG